MFGLFKTRQTNVRVIDKVWMSSAAKWSACADMAKLNPECLFIAWFDDTLATLKKVLGAHAGVMSASQAGPQYAQGRMVVFVEHYPLSDVEHDLFSRLGVAEVPVLSALDEPMFMKFAGERMIDLMRKLGMHEHDVIGHSMITRSIYSTQKKIARRAGGDIKSASQVEWFERNFR